LAPRAFSDSNLVEKILRFAVSEFDPQFGERALARDVPNASVDQRRVKLADRTSGAIEGAKWVQRGTSWNELASGAEAGV
jgi:hypothetical protein